MIGLFRRRQMMEPQSAPVTLDSQPAPVDPLTAMRARREHLAARASALGADLVGAMEREARLVAVVQAQQAALVEGSGSAETVGIAQRALASHAQLMAGISEAVGVVTCEHDATDRAVRDAEGQIERERHQREAAPLLAERERELEAFCLTLADLAGPLRRVEEIDAEISWTYPGAPMPPPVALRALAARVMEAWPVAVQSGDHLAFAGWLRAALLGPLRRVASLRDAARCTDDC